MTSIPEFMLPMSVCAFRLRLVKKHLALCHSRTLDYVPLAYKWSETRLGYIDNISFVETCKGVETKATLTEKGSMVYDALKDGLVWSIRDHRISYSLTKRWYESALNLSKNGIPQRLFILLSKINHPCLLDDSEFKRIKSELLLFKLKSRRVIGVSDQIIQITDDCKLNYQYIKIPLI